MIQFNSDRFVNVARWDLTVNRRFYVNQAIAILVLVLIPVLLRYLWWWASGDVHLFGIGSESMSSMKYAQSSFAGNMGIYYNVFSGLLSLGCMGYVFHNLATRRGRTAELTLPASNMERFLWHVLFWVAEPWLVFLCSIVLADLMQGLLASLFGCLDGMRLLTAAWFLGVLSDTYHACDLFDNPLANGALYLSGFCFTSTFALGNAWKYRYNIVYTIAAHMGLWVGTIIVFTFLAGLLSQIVDPQWLLSLLEFDINIGHDTLENIMSVLAFLFNLALLAGIWALTYRLYCHAQITTRRNR